MTPLQSTSAGDPRLQHTPLAEGPARRRRQGQLGRVGPHSTPAGHPGNTADGFVRVGELESASPAEPLPILLYNSGCRPCRFLSSWVKRNDDPLHGGNQLIDERPIGEDPAALARIHPDLDIWKVYETIHLIMPDGSIKTGGEAVAEVLRRLPDTRWFAGLFDVRIGAARPFQVLLDFAFATLDRIRPALGCESCGDVAIPWWAKPIEWARKAYDALRGKPPVT